MAVHRFGIESDPLSQRSSGAVATMKQLLRNIPIRIKLTLMILVSCCVALVLQSILGHGILASALCILVVGLIASRLQGWIADPIVSLENTLRSVADNKDYQLRAVRYSRDEVGQCADAFNKMLTEIQKQDSELQNAHARLQDQVVTLKKEIIDRHNGNITVEHGPDGGSVFTVWLPAASNDRIASASTEEAMPAAATETSD